MIWEDGSRFKMLPHSLTLSPMNGGERTERLCNGNWSDQNWVNGNRDDWTNRRGFAAERGSMIEMRCCNEKGRLICRPLVLPYLIGFALSSD
jgi:hypothetical protein